jgi:hypothetical protein
MFFFYQKSKLLTANLLLIQIRIHLQNHQSKSIQL